MDKKSIQCYRCKRLRNANDILFVYAYGFDQCDPDKIEFNEDDSLKCCICGRSAKYSDPFITTGCEDPIQRACEDCISRPEWAELKLNISSVVDEKNIEFLKDQ